jgi:diketogulonate reductase-like aldo/keto reductase
MFYMDAQGKMNDMLHRAIPASGEKLPVIGLGTYGAFDVSASESDRTPLREAMRRLVEGSARVVDTSPMYGRAEAVVGELQAELGLRTQLFLATKVWTRGREAGVRQMEASLRLLRTERIDLMQIHNLVDVETHTATLQAWKQQDRLRYIGITHYHDGAHAELAALLRTARYDFVQLNYSIAERAAERIVLPLARDAGVAVIANRPFAQAALFSRVRGTPLPQWAGELECTSWAELFLKYVVSHPAVTCTIPATRRPEHMASNLRAGAGRMPDEQQRLRMAEFFDRL